MRRLLLVVLLTAVALAGCGTPRTTPRSARLAAELTAFRTELESLRQAMHIPGMAAAVVKDGEVVWAHGLGYADVEQKVPVKADTPFHVASVTKTSAAVVVMRLVEEGKLSLDDPVSRYGVVFPEGDQVLVRHLLSHTSEGVPGQRFNYNGMRFGTLSQVVLGATGRPLQDWLYELILSPLGMTNTAPGPAAVCSGLSFAAECERVEAALAVPYMLDAELNPVRGYYGDSYNAGAGLMSTVLDLAKFDAAMDRNQLVTAETKEQMWTPTRSNAGEKLPYGLGWFTQEYRGTRMIWHTGFSPPSTSALYLKLPEEGLTLIVLANTDLLSRTWASTGTDVLASPVAVAFYKHLVVRPRYGAPLPVIDYTRDSSAVLTEIQHLPDEAVRDILFKDYQARNAVIESLGDVQKQITALETMKARAEELYQTQNPLELERYTGEYEFPGLAGTVITITLEQDRLVALVAGKPPMALLPNSATTFFVAQGYETIEFRFGPDPANGAQRLTLWVWGQSFAGRRK